MAVGTRSGRYYAVVYLPGRQRRWLGTFDDFESARAAEVAAKRPKRRPRRAAGAVSWWSLASKGELLCRNCGDEAVVLHHMVPRAAAGGDELENGLPLCDECHRGWHSLAKTITREKLTDEEIAYIILRKGQAWIDRFYPRPTDRRHAEQANELELLRAENIALRDELAGLRNQLLHIREIVGWGESIVSRPGVPAHGEETR